METRSEQSAEAVVAANTGRRAEREDVFETMSMAIALHWKSVSAERARGVSGEAGRDPVGDEAASHAGPLGATDNGLMRLADRLTVANTPGLGSGFAGRVGMKFVARQRRGRENGGGVLYRSMPRVLTRHSNFIIELES